MRHRGVRGGRDRAGASRARVHRGHEPRNGGARSAPRDRRILAAPQGPDPRPRDPSPPAARPHRRPARRPPDADRDRARHAQGRNRPAFGPSRPERGTPMARIAAADVHGVLGRHMLSDGFDLVLDLERSRGARLRDARSGRTFLDFFVLRPAPTGLNHPKMADGASAKTPARRVVEDLELGRLHGRWRSSDTFRASRFRRSCRTRSSWRRDAGRRERDQGGVRLEGVQESARGGG